MNLSRLTEPFDPQAINWRVGSIAKPKPNQTRRCTLLCYLDARMVMGRLDEVFGPGGWSTKYRNDVGGVVCSLSCKVGDEWVTKENAADPTDIEAVKGGLSDAFKRAAVDWGIGRYLYDVDTGWHDIKDGWANGNGIDISERGKGHLGYCRTPGIVGPQIENPGAKPRGQDKPKGHDSLDSFGAPKEPPRTAKGPLLLIDVLMLLKGAKTAEEVAQAEAHGSNLTGEDAEIRGAMAMAMANVADGLAADHEMFDADKRALAQAKVLIKDFVATANAR